MPQFVSFLDKVIEVDAILHVICSILELLRAYGYYFIIALRCFATFEAQRVPPSIGFLAHRCGTACRSVFPRGLHEKYPPSQIKHITYFLRRRYCRVKACNCLAVVGCRRFLCGNYAAMSFVRERFVCMKRTNQGV